MGRLLIAAGLLLVILGAILTWAPWLLNWFGRLPGDIRIERENGSVFIPITSMIVVSLLLSIVMSFLFRR